MWLNNVWKSRFWLALVPIVAVWLVAIATSVNDFYSLVDVVADSTAQMPVRAAPDSSVTTAGEQTATAAAEEQVEDAGHIATAVAGTAAPVAAERLRPSPLRDIQVRAYDAGVPDETRLPVEASDEFAESLSGISDPRIRALVIPAIED